MSEFTGLCESICARVGPNEAATMYQVRSFELFYAQMWDNQGSERALSAATSVRVYAPYAPNKILPNLPQTFNLLPLSPHRLPIFFSFAGMLDFIEI